MTARLDRQLARYRAALDAGADPAVVAGWIAEVQAKRAKLERTLAQQQEQERGRHGAGLTVADIRALLQRLPEIVKVLAEASPADKAQLYGEFGLRLVYHPNRSLVAVSANPLGLEAMEAGVHKLCRRTIYNHKPTKAHENAEAIGLAVCLLVARTQVRCHRWAAGAIS